MNYPVTYEFLGFGSYISWMTLMKMKRIIQDSSRNPKIVQTARNIVRYVPEKDFASEAATIYDWVRSHSKYVRDPQGTETITTPPLALDIIKTGRLFEGDCDDLTVLTLSLLKAIGFPVKLVATSYNKSRELTHVYGKVALGSNWIPIEPIKRGVQLGWEAPGKTFSLEVKV